MEFQSTDADVISLEAKSCAAFIVAAYILDLHMQAQRRGLTELVFLSRDGLIIMKAIKQFHANLFSTRDRVNQAPCNYTYLLTSRRSAYAISCMHENDIFSSFRHHRFKGTLKRCLECRFGLVISDIDDKTIYDTSQDNQKLFSELSLHAQTILHKCKTERETYVKYLEKKTQIIGKDLLLADIGVNGSAQKGLDTLSLFDCSGHYVFGKTETDFPVNKYSYSFLHAEETSYFMPIVESLLSAPHPSFQYFDEQLKPRFDNYCVNASNYRKLNFLHLVNAILYRYSRSLASLSTHHQVSLFVNQCKSRATIKTKKLYETFGSLDVRLPLYISNPYVHDLQKPVKLKLF